MKKMTPSGAALEAPGHRAPGQAVVQHLCYDDAADVVDVIVAVLGKKHDLNLIADVDGIVHYVRLTK
jgi:hypothetical protein